MSEPELRRRKIDEAGDTGKSESETERFARYTTTEPKKLAHYHNCFQIRFFYPRYLLSTC
jgi:hypothetical protein